MTTTPTQRVQLLRQRRKALGLIRVEFYLTQEHAAKVRGYVRFYLTQEHAAKVRGYVSKLTKEKTK